MRRNLLVLIPEFGDFDLYNNDLLKRSSELLKREHYILKQSIVDLHFEDIIELNQLPPTYLFVHQYPVGNLIIMVDLQLKINTIFI